MIENEQLISDICTKPAFLAGPRAVTTLVGEIFFPQSFPQAFSSSKCSDSLAKKHLIFYEFQPIPQRFPHASANSDANVVKLG